MGDAVIVQELMPTLPSGTVVVVVVVDVVLEEVAAARTVEVELDAAPATGATAAELTVVDDGGEVVTVVAEVVDVVVVAAATRSLTLGSSGFVDVTSNTCGGCDST